MSSKLKPEELPFHFTLWDKFGAYEISTEVNKNLLFVASVHHSLLSIDLGV